MQRAELPPLPLLVKGQGAAAPPPPVPAPLTELRGGLVVNIVAQYGCKRKMLEETETEETIGLATHMCWAVLFQE